MVSMRAMMSRNSVFKMAKGLNEDSKHPQMRLWMYRLLFKAGIYKVLVRDKDFMDDEVAKVLGFGDYVEGQPGAQEFDKAKILAKMRADWQQAEQEFAREPILAEQSKAVARLGERLGLSAVESEIIAFRLASTKKCLRDLIVYTGQVAVETLIDILSGCLDRTTDEVRTALSPTGPLIESGIIDLRGRGGWAFYDAIDLMACLSEEIYFEHENPLAYFRDRLVKSDQSRLRSDDFPHLAKDLEILKRYLQAATSNHKLGVNVLLHGDPGTGKTEFVRMLADELGMNLYEVAVSSRSGLVLDAEERFRAFRLGQVLLGKSNDQMILFDEIEDVFLESDRSPKTGANRSQRKAWVNRLMEKNPVPSFWITNNTWMIDRAFLRRFDYVLAMDVPPRSVRGRVLTNYLSELPVSETWIRKMIEHEGLAPAVVEKAAKVVESIKHQMPQLELEKALSRTLGNTLEVMGLPREPRHRVPASEYRLEFLNADCDLAQVQEGLKHHQEGRICLYGPPGSGKTAFGQYLAEVLDKPMLIKRASDIVSPWVGETEKNLAKMFRHASEEDAVLLLDEADSFLHDRQHAVRGWEVSQVNEMLTQMESFQGIFIASTNLMANLDSAALRRFDLKIQLDYLNAEQAWAMFETTRSQLGIAEEQNLRSPLAQLGCLTPGDFANVIRQSRLGPVTSSMALLHRLRSECEMKPEGKRRSIGFAA